MEQAFDDRRMFDAGIQARYLIDRGYSLLVLASESRSMLLTKKLLATGADVKGPSGRGGSLIRNWMLWHMDSRGRFHSNDQNSRADVADVVRLILKRGATFSASRLNTATEVLVSAVASRNPDLIKAVRDHYGDIFPYGAVKAAIHKSLSLTPKLSKINQEVVASSLKELPLESVTLNEEQWVRLAINYRSIKVLKVLITASARFSNQALIELCSINDVNFIELVLNLAKEHADGPFAPNIISTPIDLDGSLTEHPQLKDLEPKSIRHIIMIVNEIPLLAGLACQQRLFLLAIRRGMIQVCRYLIFSGVDLNSKEPMLPLLQACYSEKKENMAQLLLNCGASIFQTNNLTSSLWLAIELSKPDLVKDALSRGAYLASYDKDVQDDLDPTRKFIKCESSLTHAIRVGNQSIIDLLLRNDKDWNNEISFHVFECFSYAIRLKNMQAVQSLVIAINGVFPSYMYRDYEEEYEFMERLASKELQDLASPMVEAIRSGNWEFVEILIAAGFDINYVRQGTKRISALHASVIMGDITSIRKLLALGADPSDSEALEAAVGLDEDSYDEMDLEHKSCQVMELLLYFWRGRCSIDQVPYFAGKAMATAVTTGKDTLVSILLNYGFPIGPSRDRSLRKSLLSASLLSDYYYTLDIAFQLLNYGADPNECDRGDLLTALGAACTRSCFNESRKKID